MVTEVGTADRPRGGGRGGLRKSRRRWWHSHGRHGDDCKPFCRVSVRAGGARPCSACRRGGKTARALKKRAEGGGRALLVLVAAWAPRTGWSWGRTRRPPARRGGSAPPGRASSDPFPAIHLVRVSSTARSTPHHPRQRPRPGQRRANDRWAPVSTFGFPSAHYRPTALTACAHTRPAAQRCGPVRSRARTYMHETGARHGRVDRTVGGCTTVSGTHANRCSPAVPVGVPDRRVWVPAKRATGWMPSEGRGVKVGLANAGPAETALLSTRDRVARVLLDFFFSLPVRLRLECPQSKPPTPP